jgi:acyl-CoA synthetase (NDP forming)/GNAT superfamily N-acetyltransferase
LTALTAPGCSYALLADGTTITIRPARPDDFARVKRLHDEMSVDNLYLRFFSLSRNAGEQEARRVTRADGSPHESPHGSPDGAAGGAAGGAQQEAQHGALLGLLGEELVGVASYEPTGQPGTAEVAFAVADSMHHRGVATLLLEHLVSLARARGVRVFIATTLLENTAMLHVFADAGLCVTRRLADGVVELTMPIPRSAGLGEPDRYLDAVAGREQRADVASLAPLLAPRSVAVLGVSQRAGSIGRLVLRNIRDAGFAGPLYAVHPDGGNIDGIPGVASASALPEAPDLAVLAVPAAATVAAAQECGQRGARSLVVITSGLTAAQSAALLDICRHTGMRLVGPNCFGVAVPGIGLNATFAAHHPLPGTAGLVVQSGGVGVALLEHFSRLGIGISSFASVGDKLDVSGNDMLQWWAGDGRTRLAVLYLESFGHPRKFARSAARVGATMPVLTVHAGRSAPGTRLAASHTAAAAAPLITRQALFEQAGVIATTSLGELLEAAVLLAEQPVPAGSRVSIISNAGGACVLAADASVEAGLAVATTSRQVQAELAAILPAAAAVAGPIDTTAAVGAGSFAAALATAAGDAGVDMVLALVVPTAAADLIPALTAAKLPVPLAAVLLDQAESVRLLPGAVGEPGVPAYAYPESAARALGRAARYGSWRSRPAGTVPDIPGLRVAEAKALIASFLAEMPGGGWLPAADADRLLRCYQLPLAPFRLVTNADQAAAAAAELGGHVAVKAEVPGLVHKTAAGAVLLDQHGPDQAREAFGALAGRFAGRFSGAVVQPMITSGTEVIIGVVQEPVFGPLVVFGLGGVATEVLGDRAARLAPLTTTDADDLIHSIRGAPLLLGQHGQHGQPPASIAALRDTLLRVSRLADDLPEVTELDLNPVIACADGATVVDARIRVSAHAAADPFLRQLPQARPAQI